MRHGHVEVKTVGALITTKAEAIAWLTATDMDDEEALLRFSGHLVAADHLDPLAGDMTWAEIVEWQECIIENGRCECEG